MEKKSLFDLNVNDFTEEKQGLTYLSWAHAWKIFKEHYPQATYQIMMFPNGNDPTGHGDRPVPYTYDNALGYMVHTSVEVDGQQHQMWLPVMDGANRAMKSRPYKYETRNGEKTVQAATMFDINTAIMRCLVKNLAMFGLGLYIYAGEDIPFSEDETTPVKKEPAKKTFTPKTNSGF